MVDVAFDDPDNMSVQAAEYGLESESVEFVSYRQDMEDTIGEILRCICYLVADV
jgi:hypothetical protein